MPTYDYICKSCDHRFEEFQSMSAKVLRTCPKCGKKSLERLIGIGAGVLFKGGGFYETDYRSESYTKSAEAEKKAAAGGESAKPDAPSGDAKKSESAKSEGAKPETKSDSAPTPKADTGDKSNKAAPAPKSDATPKSKKSSAKKSG